MRPLSLAALLLPALSVTRCSSSAGPQPSTDAAGMTDAGARSMDAAAPDAFSRDLGPMQPDAEERIHGPFLDKDCDPLVPERCGLPFPSNVYTRDDPSTPTGLRVAFGATTLPARSNDGRHLDPAAWSDGDGFSPGQAPFTQLTGAVVTGLPSIDTIRLSVTNDSPTILMQADNRILIPHFAEVDSSTSSAGQQVLMIRPVVRLSNATRYIVAIRHVVDRNGQVIPPSPVFNALKTGGSSREPSVELRRSLYADIFGRLEQRNIPRNDLQIAWDFTTASDQNLTGWMVSMRDDAYDFVGANGPEYRITDVIENPHPRLRRRIRGMMTVPLYLDRPDPGGRMVFGDDSKPRRNGTAEFPFVVHVPNSAVHGTPGLLLQNGHGLLTSRDQGGDTYLADIADSKNYVVFAVDWIGLSEADQDFIVRNVLSDVSTFRSVTDRLHQSLINQLLAMRMMLGRFVHDPNVQFDGASAIAGNVGFYRGDSQGGIMGVPYMALSKDVGRGLLGVAGMAYDLLLFRSTDFTTFLQYLKLVYPDARDRQIAIALVQMFWDRVEGTGYAQHVIHSPLMGNSPKQVLIHVAIGDFQVSSLGGELLARSIGVPNMAPVVRHVFGLEELSGPLIGSGLVEWDFGIVEPTLNVPPTGPEEDDPHPKLRELPASQAQTDIFFRTGVIDMSVCGMRCSGM